MVLCIPSAVKIWLGQIVLLRDQVHSILENEGDLPQGQDQPLEINKTCIRGSLVRAL